MKRILKIAFVLLGVCFVLVVAAVSTSLVWPLETPPNPGKSDNFAIEGVNIVDVKSGAIRNNMTVLVERGAIASILAAGEFSDPESYQRIQAEGKYLIPGLWDMHTHSYKLSPQLHHPLYIANGVTAVRDMSGCMQKEDSYWACPEDRARWTAEALAGNRVSPRYVLQSSYQTNGGNEVPETFPSYFKLETSEHARTLVARYASTNVDFIKTYSELSTDQYSNLADATASSKLYLAGHKPIRVSLLQAVAARQKSIEHGRLFLFECYAFIDDFRQLNDPILQYNAKLMWKILSNQDEAACQSLMQQMAKSETWWVPTLSTLKMSAYSRETQFREDPRLDEIPYIIKTLIWFPDAERAASAEDNKNGEFIHRVFYDKARSQVRQASQAGVKLLAGTDASDTYVFIGSGLHDELEALVNAGLSPLSVLQAATISAARFSGLENKLGSIETKKLADLVLLGGNPLANINQVRNIVGVMQNGLYYDREALDRLRNFSTSQANKVSVNARYLWSMLASAAMRMQLAD